MLSLVRIGALSKATTRFASVGNIRYASDKVSKEHISQEDINNLPVRFDDIVRAHHKIRSGVSKTDCRYSKIFSELCDANVYLKMDLNLVTGSFKERGARNALMNLTDEEKKHGVISASAGNHALAMAYHGRDLGIPVTVVMPKIAPLTKINRCRTYGADVILHGEHIGEAREYAYAKHPTLKYINGYNDVEIVAGAGTMGIEILEQVPDVDVVICPVGGGGLIAGLSLAMKTLKPSCQIISAEPVNCASYQKALEYGEPTDAFLAPTLADGLAVPIIGDISFSIAKHFVDDTCVVNEMQIAKGILRLLEDEKIVAEGGGGTGVATIIPDGPLYGKFKGKTIVIPLCGGNIDTTVMSRVIDRGLAADKRIVKFSVTVPDRPGGLALLTKHIADIGVSVKDLYHERAWAGSLDKVVVKCVVETNGKQHADQLFQELQQYYDIEEERIHF